METRNMVFVASSLDGYIADKEGKVDWLNFVPNPEGIDMGFLEFMNRVDAIVMGRSTFETVCGFDMDWPYTKPVFVLSRTLKEIPGKYKNKAAIVKGKNQDILKELHNQNFHKLYIDGGIVIQRFLSDDLIDDIIVSTIPVLLGGGISLFAELNNRMDFNLVKSEVFLDEIVQTHYKRIRS